jgi:heme-degrading monooxygenase HmoA
MIGKPVAAPYYAVIFTSEQTADTAGYEAMAARMLELAAAQPGYLGIESARSGLGITVSYWRDLDAIARWQKHAEHLVAQRLGREKWYQHYTLRVARVEQEWSFHRNDARPRA